MFNNYYIILYKFFILLSYYHITITNNIPNICNLHIYRERHPRIEQLLSNEYQRIWWREKLIWDKTVVAKKIASKKILPRKVNN